MALSLWFGFNYVVLAERAMDQVVQTQMIPQCMKELESSQNSVRLPSIAGLPKMPRGYPDILNPAKILERLTGSLRISSARRKAICICGAKRTARRLRFDYAIHTASFRLIKPGSVSSMRDSAISLVKSQACGALPWLNLGRR